MDNLSTSQVRVNEKLKQLNQSDRIQLLQKIRRNREQRVKLFLNQYDEEEKSIMDKKLMTKQHQMLQRSISYSPSLETSALVKVKMDMCFHFLFYVKKEEAQQNESVCSICVKQLQQDQKVTMLSCKHCFHMKCIQKWFMNKIICPNCRSSPSQQLNPVDKRISELMEIKRSVMKRQVAIQTRMEEIINFKSRSLYD